MKTEDKIIKIISELTVVKAESIKAQDRLREDLGLDSVMSMELLSALAEEYDLDIEMEEAIAATTVADVIEMTRRRLGVDAA